MLPMVNILHEVRVKYCDERHAAVINTTDVVRVLPEVLGFGDIPGLVRDDRSCIICGGGHNMLQTVVVVEAIGPLGRVDQDPSFYPRAMEAAFPLFVGFLTAASSQDASQLVPPTGL